MAMATRHVDGWKIGEMIGQGGCGRVFHATDEEGGAHAIKILDEKSVNRPLLDATTQRLAAGGWPDGVLPAEDADFQGRSSARVMPLMADAGDDDTLRPHSLQHRLDDHPGIESWRVVRAIAAALADMHARAVFHGNLKPGNIFLDDGAGVKLSDWCLGRMPGVKHFEFTDAVLYQPPEQLRATTEAAVDAGYRWDVHAFGVLAFRLLTGRFPRCEETFGKVAPPAGETRREGITADLQRVAANLEAKPEFSWPDEAQGELERGLRAWIDRCLALDPEQRPRDMVEVADGFAALERELAATREREHLLDSRRRAERRSALALFGMGAAAATALVLGGLWHLRGQQLTVLKTRYESEAKALKQATDQARADLNTAEERMAQAEQALDYERQVWQARLEASRQISDRLFAWAMEKGHRRLPPLDGRELRLKRLERYFEDFLDRTADIPDLVEERAQARIQLAEISLAAGDAGAATRRLEDALKVWSSLQMDADLKLRLATNQLLLALLRQSQSDPASGEAFAAARKAFAAVPRSEVDGDRLDQLLAILDFHEAGLLAARGDDVKALEQLMRATQTLNRIAEQRPDAAILRSELAACYLSSAGILEGMGNLGDAREVRSLAAAELRKLRETNPTDPALRLELAACYGAMAEAAALAGDISGAESLSREAMRLLDEHLAEQPEDTRAISNKAAQLGLRGGILRDRGQSAEALRDFDEGIRMLEGVRASHPADAMAAYRLALLWWQKGRMLGMSGARDEEIALLGRARDLLASLESATPAAGPSPEQLQRSGAYLAGDLGHALQLAGRMDDAARAFTSAVELWQGLADSRPQSEEYQEALLWSRQRLDDVQ